jgi:hypothetical protein
MVEYIFLMHNLLEASDIINSFSLVIRFQNTLSGLSRISKYYAGEWRMKSWVCLMALGFVGTDSEKFNVVRTTRRAHKLNDGRDSSRRQQRKG